jgi:site-specific recombinase XerC
MTARGRQTAVRQFAPWLVDVGEITADPFDEVRRPRIDTKVVVPLTDDQMRA